jgi:RimJ/RimL family protein N-acetyltransferase
MILYYCPLPVENGAGPLDLDVERVVQATLAESDLMRLINSWNTKVRARQITERFEAGSELWLVKVDGELAGFGWSIRGHTIEPHFFPVQPNDVHLFDFFIFSEFRGKGINGALLMNILARVSREEISRAYIECAAWNEAQIRSLRKTTFRRYAEAVKVTFHGRPIVFWHKWRTNKYL